MPSADEWKRLILEEASKRPRPIKAIEYRRPPVVASFASPPLLACADGQEYWVKSMVDGSVAKAGVPREPHATGMITDQIVGRLARRLGVEAVPEVRIVDIVELAAIAPQLATAHPGLSHGSKNAATNCTGRSNFSHGSYCELPMNRPRVAALAVLYGLAFASDHQVIYQVGGESLVFSVDHGHFFHRGPNWTADTLERAPEGAVDSHVVTTCKVTRAELAAPLGHLDGLTSQHIAECVAAPPDEWGFAETERVAVAEYLWKRRGAILTAIV